jgi:hypothetical protein
MLESHIKLALKQYLAGGDTDLPLKILTEVQIGSDAARADLVEVENFHCYEIKSDRDSLRRLIDQGSRYIQVFDRVTLVTAQRHLELALQMVPSWWGVVLIPDDVAGDLKELRAAQPNSRQTTYALAKLLKKDECLNILKDANLHKGLSSKSLYKLQEFIACNFCKERIRDLVKVALFAREEDSLILEE